MYLAGARGRAPFVVGARGSAPHISVGVWSGAPTIMLRAGRSPDGHILSAVLKKLSGYATIERTMI